MTGFAWEESFCCWILKWYWTNSLCIVLFGYLLTWHCEWNFFHCARFYFLNLEFLIILFISQRVYNLCTKKSDIMNREDYTKSLKHSFQYFCYSFDFYCFFFFLQGFWYFQFSCAIFLQHKANDKCWLNCKASKSLSVRLKTWDYIVLLL